MGEGAGGGEASFPGGPGDPWHWPGVYIHGGAGPWGPVRPVLPIGPTWPVTGLGRFSGSTAHSVGALEIACTWSQFRRAPSMAMAAVREFLVATDREASNWIITRATRAAKMATRITTTHGMALARLVTGSGSVGYSLTGGPGCLG